MTTKSDITRPDKFGRIKLPAAFRRAVEETSDGEIFITPTDDRTLKIYPLAAWHARVDKLLKEKRDDRLLRRFLLKANYDGQVVRVDKFGRVQIPGFIRKKIKLEGGMAIEEKMGYLELKPV